MDIWGSQFRKFQDFHNSHDFGFQDPIIKDKPALLYKDNLYQGILKDWDWEFNFLRSNFIDV